MYTIDILMSFFLWNNCNTSGSILVNFLYQFWFLS